MPHHRSKRRREVCLLFSLVDLLFFHPLSSSSSFFQCFQSSLVSRSPLGSLLFPPGRLLSFSLESQQRLFISTLFWEDGYRSVVTDIADGMYPLNLLTIAMDIHFH